MEIKKAEFISSNTDITKLPKEPLPEYAFIGRSNVGKSSLINMLANHKNLAKTSATPGKTQLINHFKINDNWYLVDLPGYGYAKTSKTQRKQFSKMIKDYLANRKNLVNTYLCWWMPVTSRKKSIWNSWNGWDAKAYLLVLSLPKPTNYPVTNGARTSKNTSRKCSKPGAACRHISLLRPFPRRAGKPSWTISNN